MKKHKITDILIYIFSAELAGALSALLSGGFSDFFEKFKEPPLLPPSWLFPIVWTILYAVMGASAYIVSVSDNDSAAKNALNVYWIQLGVNFLWSIVFFRFEAPWAAFGVIILLLILIIIMIALFWKASPVAAIMNIPYLLWVIFASYLNFQTALIN
ncbi:MAG: tryptophan-rich sensory protein [Oscillospiraceae bacterium]|nr:tryptophan-rich sensory protein [Oscillospiraceae bacterium]